MLRGYWASRKNSEEKHNFFLIPIFHFLAHLGTANRDCLKANLAIDIGVDELDPRRKVSLVRCAPTSLHKILVAVATRDVAFVAAKVQHHGAMVWRGKTVLHGYCSRPG